MLPLNNKTFLRIFTMVIVLAMTLSCLAACGIDGGNTAGNDHRGNSDKNTIDYEWNGLHYSLSKDYTDAQVGGDQYASYVSGSLMLIVDDDVTPEGVTDSQSYAAHYENEKKAYFEISVKSKNGIYYTVMDCGDGTKEARAFYVDGKRCWVMAITSYDFDQHLNSIVAIITSGTIGQYDDSTDEENNATSSTSPSQNNTSTPSTVPTVPNDMIQHSYHGLSYFLGKDYNAIDLGEYMMHSNGSVSIIVTFGTTPEGVTDSRSYADQFVSETENAGYTCTRRYQNGVHYTITDWNDGSTEVRAFYVQDGYCWIIYATSMNYTSESATLIQYVTSGVIG